MDALRGEGAAAHNGLQRPVGHHRLRPRRVTNSATHAAGLAAAKLANYFRVVLRLAHRRVQIDHLDFRIGGELLKHGQWLRQLQEFLFALDELNNLAIH